MSGPPGSQYPERNYEYFSNTGVLIPFLIQSRDPEILIPVVFQARYSNPDPDSYPILGKPNRNL
jgi:hypothetical protein